jgi:hypothetical protein
MSGSASNTSSSIVISFSIAILLLLVLLLLLSYNSRFKNDKVERFESNNSIGNMFGQEFDSRVANLANGFNSALSTINNRNEQFSSTQLAANDPYLPNGSQSIAKQETLSGIQPSGADEMIFANADGFTNQYEQFTNNQTTTDPTTCIKKDKLTAQDLLPKDVSNLKWSQTNPSSIGDITDQNFLTAGYHIGVNTIGQTLKNANLQLRSEIPNPQVAVSPWMISTIEPDVRSTTLEIGSAPTY